MNSRNGSAERSLIQRTIGVDQWRVQKGRGGGNLLKGCTGGGAPLAKAT